MRAAVVGIVSVVWRNLTAGSRARKPGDLVVRPLGFRGMIEHEASLCTGCRTCAYVCSPQAISFTEMNSGVAWRFFAGQCSFCGLCVKYCPTHAITNNGKLPPVTGDQSQHRVEHLVPYQACAVCSTPIITLPEATEEQQLCPTCRRKEASRRIAGALLNP